MPSFENKIVERKLGRDERHGAEPLNVLVDVLNEEGAGGWEYVTHGFNKANGFGGSFEKSEIVIVLKRAVTVASAIAVALFVSVAWFLL